MRADFKFFLVATTISCLALVQATSPVLSKLSQVIKAHSLNSEAKDPKLVRTLLDNDFESGSTNPWFDESPGYVNWRVESLDSPSEANSPAPAPVAGTNYLRATRNADLLSGLAVLKSPVFTANPGDRISFDFWIRSKRPEGNNLELIWLANRTEYLLAGLSPFSTAANFEWRTQSVTIPVDYPTDGTLVFYGYCGSNIEDAIGIDNIVVESSTFTTQAPGTNCIDLYATVGTFTSPNYPSNYPNNANICWLITGAYAVTLEFNSFSTEIGKDSLKIYLGDTTTSELYADLSGQSRPGTISQTTSSMLIVFTSDSANTNSGFSIQYSVTKATTTPIPETTTEFICQTDFTTTGSLTPPPTGGTCGGTFTDYSGSISSTNYPYPYCNNLDCRYLIRVPPGYRVQLYFDDFYTESSADVVTIYDGSSTNNGVLLRASGSSRPTSYIYSSSNQMLVRFETDGSVAFSGWKAIYSYY